MAFSGIASFTDESSWTGIFNWVAAVLGISTAFPSLVSNPLIWDSMKLLVLGSVLETGRRVFRWIVDRFRFRCSISAEFKAGNPTYEWLVSYLTNENIWRTPRDFLVDTKSTQRKWKIDTGDENTQVDYIPAYDSMTFFRWKGYLLEVSQSRNKTGFDEPVVVGTRYGHGTSLYLKIYTRDTSVLFSFVEDCRLKYAETTKLLVTVQTAGGRGYEIDGHWGISKTKHRRPLDSLLLDEDVIGSLLADAREFLEIEDWYVQAGIPHRRGYLLHGPPGTGKTSTVYTVAGELGLEIYSLSLSSPNMDDDYLCQMVSRLPPRGILLIEDIDCAFPSREEEEEEEVLRPVPRRSRRHSRSYNRSQITLSGLLNMLDGIGSEEGKIFFATTNHIDRLDPALLRPGRIDRKIEYKLASQRQARALFARFFPASRFSATSDLKIGEKFGLQPVPNVDELADAFSCAMPENEFSIAEIQGHLLAWKMNPLNALHSVEEWVENERATKRDREDREKLRKERMAAAKVQEQLTVSEAVIAGIGTAMAHGQIPDPRPLPAPTPAAIETAPEVVFATASPTAGPGDSLARRDSVKINGVNHTPPDSPAQSVSTEMSGVTLL